MVAITGYSHVAGGHAATSYSVVDTAYCGIEVYRAYAYWGSRGGATRLAKAERECERLNNLDRSRSTAIVIPDTSHDEGEPCPSQQNP